MSLTCESLDSSEIVPTSPCEVTSRRDAMVAIEHDRATPSSSALWGRGGPARADRLELARLELALDLVVDAVLGRGRVGAPQLEGAQAAELDDRQHVAEVGAPRD